MKTPFNKGTTSGGAEIGFLIIAVIVLFCTANLHIPNSGQHTGYVSSVEQSGIIWKTWTAYIKTDPQSSQEDAYCVTDSYVVNTVWERFKLLPQISALSATLLIVATFNKKILPLTHLVLVLLMVLLILIPISLIGYLVELRKSEDHARKSIIRIGGDEDPLPVKSNYFTAYLAYIVVAIISVAILFLILSIMVDYVAVGNSSFATL